MMPGKKKIAYLRSSNVYSDSRATKEILCLLDAGYDVTVLSWDRDGKENDYFHSVFGDSVKRKSYEVRVSGNLGRKGIVKLVAFSLWCYKTLFTFSFDAVHACDFDTGPVAAWYCKRKSCKFIYDIYDYYADSHGVEGILRRLLEKAENKVIDNADLTIICTEERRDQIKKAKPRKVAIIYNSPEITKISDNEGILYDYVYCGSLYNGRLLKEIFDQYYNNTDLKLCIAGRGILEQEAAKCVCDHFTFLGSIPYSQVLKEESRAIAISAIYEPTSRNNKLCAPNKFYEAMALSKPVIVCKGSGIDRIVKDQGIGIVIDYNAAEFYHELRWLKDHPEDCKDMGRRGRALYDSKYAWSLMKERLTEEYRQLFSE